MGWQDLTAENYLTSIAKIGVNSTVSAGIRTALLGGDFEDNFLDALKFNAANVIVEPIGFNIVGDIIGSNVGSLEAALLHAIIGAAGGYISGGLEGLQGGALGAFLGELVVSGDPSEMSDAAKSNMLVVQQIIGGLASFAVGDASMAGVDAAVNGYIYNYLRHDQVSKLLENLKECGDDKSCQQRAIEIAAAQSNENSTNLQNCGADKQCYLDSLKEMAEVRLSNEDKQFLSSFTTENGNSLEWIVYGNDYYKANFNPRTSSSDRDYALDALQILYGNKDLYLKIPNSEFGKAWEKLQDAVNNKPDSNDPEAMETYNASVAKALNEYMAVSHLFSAFAGAAILEQLGIAGGAIGAGKPGSSKDNESSSKGNENSGTNSGSGSSNWKVPEQATNQFPEGWDVMPNSKGEGFRWQDPNYKGNGVRIDRGNPNSEYNTQIVDHVIVRSNGQVIGRDGKPITGSISAELNKHIFL